MKDGTKRKLRFVEMGKNKVSLSPSQRNLTISAQHGKNKSIEKTFSPSNYKIGIY